MCATPVPVRVAIAPAVKVHSGEPLQSWAASRCARSCTWRQGLVHTPARHGVTRRGYYRHVWHDGRGAKAYAGRLVQHDRFKPEK